jgi:hypothetical protein
MAKIICNISTNEVRRPNNMTRSWGSWEVIVTAGLDESVESVFAEARARVEGAISALPEGKRYPRFHFDAEDEGTTGSLL